MSVYSGFINESNTYDSINIKNIINDDSINEDQFDDTDISTQIFIQNETNWYKLMRAVGISELYSIENDSAVLYESTNGFFTKIKEFFLKIWEKIKAFFKKIIIRIDAISKNGVSFIKKYDKEISKIVVPSDFSYKGYRYTHLNNNDLNPGTIDTDTEFKNEGFDLSNVDNIVNITDDKQLDAIKDAINELELDKVYNALRGRLLHTNSEIESNEWHSELYKYFRNGEDTREDIDNVDINNLKNIINNTSNMKSIIEKFAKDAKTEIDKEIKRVNNTEKNLEKNNVNSSQKAINVTSMAYRKLSTFLSTSLTLSTSFYEAAMNAVEEREKTAKSIITKLLTMRKSKDDSTNESFGFNHSSPLDDLVFI